MTDLIDLAWHWDSVYRFEVVDGVWRATPHVDPATILTAETAWDLRQLVRDDYANRTRPSRVYGDPGSIETANVGQVPGDRRRKAAGTGRGRAD